MTRYLAFILLLIALASCQQAPEKNEIIVSLVADGRERTFSYTVPVTVDTFLRDAEITLDALDRVNPQPYTQITDGMRVTVVRIQERINCEQSPLPFRQRTVPNEGLQPGEERLGQAGQNGIEEKCSRIYIEDGIERDPVVISTTIITQPQDEVIYVGLSGEIAPTPINGTIAYISNRNAWIMRGSTTTKRPLTTTSDLDARVFTLSPDGRRLLFTRETALHSTEESTFNELWMLSDVSVDGSPVALLPNNILYADWVPSQENTISYSTAEVRAQVAPGWQAYNDLWMMRIDPVSGEAVNVREVIKQSCSGLYCWWGTGFQWSPDGEQLAWVRADSIGLVDLSSGELNPLISYPVFNTFQPWSWRATVSWSPNNDRLLTTTHGAPIGREPPETSPAFLVTATDTEGSFQAELFTNAGIWASPRYSPLITDADSEFPRGYIAFLRCRDFPNCVNDNAQYDLVIADRDGSNPQVLYPPDGQPGLTQRDFVWSPDGRQIAFIYQGNLWAIDVTSRIATQLTLDGGASRPVWTQ